MNILDIILLALLAVAAIAGWRKGIIVQACGIAGLVLGIMFALRFSGRIGIWLDVDEKFASILGFIIIFVISIVALAIVGYLFKKVFHLTGFGILDRIGGLVLSVVKIGLLLGILVGAFVDMNKNLKFVEPSVINDSAVYRPLHDMTEAIFPYLRQVKESITENDNQND